MTPLSQPYVAEDAQDGLRTARQFVSFLSGAFNAYDQTYANTDGMIYNVPGQYQTVGPYSTSIEGTTISTTRAGGLVISPAMVMLGIGFAVALLWKS